MKTGEDIVKQKKYFELTPNERDLVKECASNEEEYDNLKYLLSESGQYFDSRKVEASSAMREHIMEKLYPPITSSVKWYQSVWLFLFPPQKSFYQYPAFQLVGVLLVFVGIFTLYQSPFKTVDLAQNHSVQDLKEVKQPITIVEDSSTLEINENIEPELKSVEKEFSEQKTVVGEGLVDNQDKYLDAKIEEEVSFQAEDDISREITSDYLFDVSVPAAAPMLEKESLAPISANNEIVKTESSYTSTDATQENYDEKLVETQVSQVTVKKINGLKANRLSRDKDLSSSVSVTENNNLKFLFFEVK